ncbi:hypothetical protein Tco_1515908 [Tanacetum coccineum]
MMHTVIDVNDNNTVVQTRPEPRPSLNYSIVVVHMDHGVYHGLRSAKAIPQNRNDQTTHENKAASVGLAYEDSTLVRKLLNAVPDRFLQIVASIEQYSDLDEMSVDEAIGRLKTLKNRLK